MWRENHRGFESYRFRMTQLEIEFPTSAELAGVFSLSLNKDPNDLDGEEWREHPSGLMVSNLGRVKGARGGIIGSTKMRNSRAAHGVRPDYVRVTTSVNGNPVRAYAHVLVLETWVGPRPDDHDGDHINRDIFDNTLTNLRWRPSSENRSDQ